MKHTRIAIAALVLFGSACAETDSDSPSSTDGVEVTDATDATDSSDGASGETATDSTDGAEGADATDGASGNDSSDGTDNTDSLGGDIVCNNAWTESNEGDLCTTTPGGDTVWLRGDVMTPTGSLKAGSVIIQGGRIACVGCDCTADNATVIECPNSLITPGLINPHDHLGWAQDTPAPDTGKRYDHRHEWRKGKDCGGPSGPHTGLKFKSNSWNKGELWGELRMLFGGATSIAGSGGEQGLLRNLDTAGKTEGLDTGTPNAPTFPLGDSNGTCAESGCSAYELPSTGAVTGPIAYVPHVAEGIVAAARNEFLCLAGQDPGSVDAVVDSAAFIHGIGLKAPDISLMAGDGAGLVWSPRSNIALYGFTAEVGLYDRLGVLISLGTDWTPSGSMNVLRELQCADYLNTAHYDRYFSDRQLVEMVTQNAAELLGFGNYVGSLIVGKEADIAIFDGRANEGYRAVIDAEPADVALVLRSGEALYGEVSVIDALAPSDGCEQIDMCGAAKRVCLTREIGLSLAEMQRTKVGV